MRMATYHILHETVYQYSVPVRLSHQVLRLTPRFLPWQTCISHTINIAPLPQNVNIYVDSFGNALQSFSLDQDHAGLEVQAESWVEMVEHPLPDMTPGWQEVATALSYRAGRHLSDEMLDASRFLFESPHVRIKREFAAYAAQCFAPNATLLEGIATLMHRIFSEFTFDPHATTVSTPVTEVFANKRGVCQDYAHFMLSCLRSIGLAARYVSGYLLTQPPPGQARLIGADASHAWVSVYCPGPDGAPGCWIDADPTNDLFPGISHITLGWGRDFLDISPLRGVLIGGGQQTMEVAVTVRPADELPGLPFAR